MSLSIYFSSCLTRALVVVGLCLMSVAKLNAQPPESKPTRFVPADTYAAMSINWRAILKKVDFHEPLLAQLRQRDHINQSFFEDSEPERIIMLFPSQIDEKTRIASPPGMFMQFEAPVEPKAFFDRMHHSKYFETVQEDYKGQQIHVRRWSQGIHKGTESRVVWFFPEKNVVARGSRQMVRQMIDGQSFKSDAQELVNNLDPKPELHFLLEVNDKISARMLDGLFGHLTGMHGMKDLAEAMRHAKRAEFLGSYAETVPVQLTIEMKNGEAMDRLMELLKARLAQAPGALDVLEEHEIPREPEVQPPFCELLALGRTAVKKLKMERDGTTLRMTLDHVDGLEKLPQLHITCTMILVAMSGP